MAKATVLCNGCPENIIDSARVRIYLEENGWQIVDDPTTADLVLFNACGLTNSCADRSLSIIKELQKNAKNDARVIVWGCLPKIDPEALRQVYQGPAFGERELHQLDEITGAVKPISEIIANEAGSRYRYEKYVGWQRGCRFLVNLLGSYYLRLGRKMDLHRPDDSSVFYIKISTGCLGNCAYCAIRHSRGKIESKPLDKIMAEFRDGLSHGFKDFSLLGTDLGPHGRDLGYTLADLLGEMVREKGEYRIAVRNVHPYYLKQMLDELEPIFATGKIWYMGMACESGSNRILKLMRRNYTVEDFKECVRRVKRAYPDLIIRTQFMVGFPTETAQDYAESLRLLDEVKFDFVEVYRFSRRSGTAAEKMEGQVPYMVALSRRYRMLAKVQFDAMRRRKVS